MALVARELIPSRTGFGKGLAEAGALNPKVVGLGADITASVSMNLFAERFPERFFSMGIAEQNCVGVAAGLALAGKIPVFSTYGVFATIRTLDQIRISLCYNNLHAIIGGAHAGISVGPDGATHQALEDIAVMRVLPNMTVLSPCDATQARLCTLAAIENNDGPAYIRFGREAVPDFTDENQTFEIGKAQLLAKGTDVTLMATGHLVWEACQAADILALQGISAQVLNFHTIKPIDKAAIIDAAKSTRAVVTAEEHQLMGGFGSAIAEVLVMNYPVPVEMVGINDMFGESGKPHELMLKYKLTAVDIAMAAERAIQRK
ncbi:MAG: transketolase family protein [Bacteroidetes bacterium]|nr:transketolase family protein [Bacteroidota bacterium]